jgi:hypothetical protein
MKQLRPRRAGNSLGLLLLGLCSGVVLGLYGCTGADFQGAEAAAHDRAHSEHTDHGDDAVTERVMGNIRIADGEHAGDVSTVNGTVHVGDNAVVGHTQVINGTVNIGAHATASAVEAINGPVRVQDGAGIAGRVGSVNGPITLADGVDVKGEVGNVNGTIKIAGAHVGGQIRTVNGDIEVGPNGHIDGGIHVEKDNSWFHTHSDNPRVVILAGSVVKGTLRFDRPVQLYVSDQATIGPVQGATPKAFSGDSPPGS